MARCLRRSSLCLWAIQARLAIFNLTVTRWSGWICNFTLMRPIPQVFRTVTPHARHLSNRLTAQCPTPLAHR